MPIGPGLGLAPLPDVAQPAFLASLLQATTRLNTLSSVKFPVPPDPRTSPSDGASLYSKYLALAFQNKHILDEDPCVKLQHTLLEQTKSSRFSKVYDSLSDTNKTIVDSTCDTHASGWLTAIPTTPELSASNDTMTTALKTFLGIPLVTEKVTCKFCNASIDDFDKHALKCRDKGALMQRHNIIKKCVSDLCVAGGLYVDNEPSIFGFKKSDHDNHDPEKRDQRRLDLLVHGFGQNGSNLAIDVSVANPFPANLPPHPNKLAAAESRESSKNKKYLSDCYKKKIAFHPFVMDAYGGIPQRTYSYVFKPLVRKIQDYVPVNWAAPNAETYWLQRLSLTLWKGNAYKVKYLADLYR